MRKDKLEKLKRYLEELRIVKKNQVEVDYTKKFLQSEVFDITLSNGRTIRREKLIKGKNDGSAVIVLPVLESGEILTIIEPKQHGQGATTAIQVAAVVFLSKTLYSRIVNIPASIIITAIIKKNSKLYV